MSDSGGHTAREADQVPLSRAVCTRDQFRVAIRRLRSVQRRGVHRDGKTIVAGSDCDDGLYLFSTER